MDNTRILKKTQSGTESLMLHALGFITGDPSIRISYPYVFHPGMQVTVSEPGDSKWIYMMLPITRGSLITDIRIAHHRTGIQSHITLVRLVEQREPIAATVLHNDYIERTVPATSVISSACRVVVNNSVLLKVCMDFAGTDDMIELGSVEVRYIPNYAVFPKEKKKKIKSKRTIKEPTTDLLTGEHSLNLQNFSLVELFIRRKKKRHSILDY